MASYKDWIRRIDIEIDYFSAFIKAWIAFNSWYRSEYIERTDRDIIEKIKSQNNRFKTYIETFLDKHNVSNEATAFKDDLNKLQAALVNAPIVTQERGGVNQQISFSEIAINNPKTVSDEDYRQTHYNIKRTAQKIVTVVSKKGDPSIKFFELEQTYYDETALGIHPDFQKLGAEQQGQCKAFYKAICPYITESILGKDHYNNIVFISERANVSRGIVEVLYLLRCSLMHGDVSPDSSSNEVYKYAYLILAAILKKLM
jgi:hypothetical protein